MSRKYTGKLQEEDSGKQEKTGGFYNVGVFKFL
jgi:hypothetical protein